MFHYNSAWEDTLGIHLPKIMPEYYLAITIDDFLKNKDEILETKRSIPLAFFFNGYAIVEFPSLTFNHADNGNGVVSDLNSSLEVSLLLVDISWGLAWGLKNYEREQLKDGMRLYEPFMVYKPKDGSLYLAGYKTEGPPIGDKREPNISLVGKELSLISP